MIFGFGFGLALGLAPRLGLGGHTCYTHNLLHPQSPHPRIIKGLMDIDELMTRWRTRLVIVTVMATVMVVVRLRVKVG